MSAFLNGLVFSIPLSPEIHSNSPAETVDFYYNQLAQFVNRSFTVDENLVEEQLYKTADELFYISRLAPMVFGRKWNELNEYEKERFKKTLKIAAQHKIHDQIKQSSGGIPLLSLVSEETKKHFSRLDYSISGEEGRKKITVFMLKSDDGNWRISNVAFGENSLIRYYFGICKNLIDNYSIPYLEAELREQGYVVLEDFEGNEIGVLPKGWGWKKSDDNKNKPYQIKQEKGNKYLAADDHGESVILAANVKWNLKKYPYISFKWRGRRIPEGGDERFEDKIDNGAGVYVFYKRKFGLIPESVKYVWSSTLPIGSTLRLPGIGKPWMIIAESGETHLGQWRTYAFNAYEAYQKTFGGDPPNTAIGIGVLSDANNLKSHASADYDDIKALKYANTDSGIKHFLKAESISR